MRVIKSLAEKAQDIKFLRRFHGYATLVWILLVIPSVIFWAESVTWIVLMSVWANIAGHWAAWQGARGEAKADPEVDD